MKKRLLTLITTLSLSTVPISVLAQESHSTEIETSIVDEGTLIYDFGAKYQQHTKDYVALLSNIIHNAPAVQSDAEEVDNQLILDYVKKLKQHEVSIEEATIFEQKLSELTSNKVAIKQLTTSMSESERNSLSQATLTYLKTMQELLVTVDGEVYNLATNEQIELTWQLVKLVEAYGFVNADATTQFEAIKLKLAAAEFHRLVTTSFNEDGTFKDKLYSKHMTELYNLLKDKKVDFIKEYQERYDNILKEIEARKTASDAVKKIEEKRAKGETVSQEELQKVEEAVAKVQTQSHREVVQSTKEAVVTSQTNNTAYEKPTPQPAEQSQATPHTPKPTQPTEQPAPAEPTPAPQPVEPAPTLPAPEVYQIPAGFFATWDEAMAYGYSMGDGITVTSFQTYTAGFLPDGTPYYGVHLINSYEE